MVASSDCDHEILFQLVIRGISIFLDGEIFSIFSQADVSSISCSGNGLVKRLVRLMVELVKLLETHFIMPCV